MKHISTTWAYEEPFCKIEVSAVSKLCRVSRVREAREIMNSYAGSPAHSTRGERSPRPTPKDLTPKNGGPGSWIGTTASTASTPMEEQRKVKVLPLITMKLSTAIIIAAATSAPRDAAARSIVTPLSSGINNNNHLFPASSTYYEIDINAADANSIDGLGSVFGRHDLTRKYGGRSYGTASLNLPLLGQIVEEVGRDTVNAAALDAVHHR